MDYSSFWWPAYVDFVQLVMELVLSPRSSDAAKETHQKISSERERKARTIYIFINCWYYGNNEIVNHVNNLLFSSGRYTQMV